MTEREYIEAIRDSAVQYQTLLAGPSRQPPSVQLHQRVMDRWRDIKCTLSPSTAIALCDAWLAQEAPRSPEGGEASP